MTPSPRTNSISTFLLAIYTVQPAKASMSAFTSFKKTKRKDEGKLKKTNPNALSSRLVDIHDGDRLLHVRENQVHVVVVGLHSTQ